MRFILFILKKIRWHLRKLSCYHNEKLVLFIGTDIFSPPRADIIIIPYNEPITPFIKKCKRTARVFLHCNCSKIPLADKSIDFIILSSALEFCNNPSDLLSELSRVGKAGYIESANALMDRFYPHPSRVLEVLTNEQGLFLNKKTNAVNDAYLSKARLFQTNKNWMIIFKAFPQLFFETYDWKNRVEYRSFNDKNSMDSISKVMWSDFMVEKKHTRHKTKSIKHLIFEKLNLLYSINRKKRLLTFDDLIRLY